MTDHELFIRVRQDAARAASAGAPVSSCPWPFGSQEGRWWCAAWTDEMSSILRPEMDARAAPIVARSKGEQ